LRGVVRAESTPLLDRLKWGEHGCAELIDNLLRAPRGKGQGRSLVRLSYRDLGVEELGRVYEALLELEPGISAEAMVRLRRANLVVVPERKGEVPPKAMQFNVAMITEKTRPKRRAAIPRDASQSDQRYEIQDEWISDTARSILSARGAGAEIIGRALHTPDTFVCFLVRRRSAG
jgi:hypothetical protein